MIINTIVFIIVGAAIIMLLMSPKEMLVSHNCYQWNMACRIPNQLSKPSNNYCCHLPVGFLFYFFPNCHNYIWIIWLLWCTFFIPMNNGLEFPQSPLSWNLLFVFTFLSSSLHWSIYWNVHCFKAREFFFPQWIKTGSVDESHEVGVKQLSPWNLIT